MEGTGIQTPFSEFIGDPILGGTTVSAFFPFNTAATESENPSRIQRRRCPCLPENTTCSIRREPSTT